MNRAIDKFTLKKALAARIWFSFRIINMSEKQGGTKALQNWRFLLV